MVVWRNAKLAVWNSALAFDKIARLAVLNGKVQMKIRELVQLHKRAVPTWLTLLLAIWVAALPDVSAQPVPSIAQQGSFVASAQDEEVAQLASKAEQALQSSDFARAIIDFEKVVKMAPGVAEFHAALAKAYYGQGRFGDAARECEQALKLKPSLTPTKTLLGLSLADSGECLRALPYLEEGYPQADALPLKRLVGKSSLNCAIKLNQENKAIALLEALNRDFPNDSDVLYMGIHLYTDLARAYSHRLLTSAPGSFQVHKLNAELLEENGKLADAVTEYRAALALNPHLPGIHIKVGLLLLAGEPQSTTIDEARHEFEEELKVYPGSAPAYYELGQLALNSRDWTGAAHLFERAAALDPGFAAAFVGLGKCHLMAGHPSDAIGPIERAVRLQPDYEDAHYQLSLAYRRAGRTEEADRELAAYRQLHEKRVRTKEFVRGEMSRPVSEPGVPKD